MSLQSVSAQWTKTFWRPSCPPCQIGLIIAQVDIDDFQTDTVDI